VSVNQNLARLLSVGALVGMVAAAGCSGSSTSQAPMPPMSPLAQPQVRLFVPDTCGKASTQPINAAGGTLTVPACNGWGGSVAYPSNNAPAGDTVTIKSYTKLAGAPKPPAPHKAIFYVTAHGNGSGSVSFGAGTPTSTITGPGLHAGKKYSIYAYALGFLVPGFPKKIGPATNGSVSFPSPFANENVPNGITVTFELTT
jgi:hypothetical protein